MAKGPYVEIELTPEQSAQLCEVYRDTMRFEGVDYLILAQVHPAGRDANHRASMMEVCAVTGDEYRTIWDTLRPILRGTRPRNRKRTPAA